MTDETPPPSHSLNPARIRNATFRDPYSVDRIDRSPLVSWTTIRPELCTANFRFLPQHPLLPAHGTIALALDAFNTLMGENSHVNQDSYSQTIGGPVVLNAPIRPSDVIKTQIQLVTMPEQAMVGSISSGNISLTNQHEQVIATIDEAKPPLPRLRLPHYLPANFLLSEDRQTIDPHRVLSQMYKKPAIYVDRLHTARRPNMTSLSRRGIGVFTVRSRHTFNGATLPWHAMIESGFQTMGLIAMHYGFGADVVPISVGIDGQIFVNGSVGIEKRMYVYADVTLTAKRTVKGDLTITDGEYVVGIIEGAVIVLPSRREIEKRFN